MLEEIKQMQCNDPDLRQIIGWMEESSVKLKWQRVSSSSKEVKIYWGQWDSLKLHEGTLYRILDADGVNRPIWQLIVPRAARRTILQQLHNSATGGHFGFHKGKVKERFSWLNHHQYIEDWC